jgi:AefR-like transcriptional repressor, C-terminal domain
MSRPIRRAISTDCTINSWQAVKMLAIDYEVAIRPTAQMMTDWLCRQDEHGKIELEDTQTAIEMLRGMMVMDTQRAVMLGQRASLIKQRSRREQSNVHGCF